MKLGFRIALPAGLAVVAIASTIVAFRCMVVDQLPGIHSPTSQQDDPPSEGTFSGEITLTSGEMQILSEIAREESHRQSWFDLKAARGDWWIAAKQQWLAGEDGSAERAVWLLRHRAGSPCQNLFLVEIGVDSMSPRLQALVWNWLATGPLGERDPALRYALERQTTLSEKMLRVVYGFVDDAMRHGSDFDQLSAIAMLKLLLNSDARSAPMLLEIANAHHGQGPFDSAHVEPSLEVREHAFMALASALPSTKLGLLTPELDRFQADDWRWSIVLKALGDPGWFDEVQSAVHGLHLSVLWGQPSNLADAVSLGRSLRALEAGQAGSLDNEIRKDMSILAAWIESRMRDEDCPPPTEVLSAFQLHLEEMLGRQDGSVMEEFFERLSMAPPHVQARLLDCLTRRCSSITAHDALIKILLHHEDPRMRGAAAVALTGYRFPIVLSTLQEAAASDVSAFVRKEAVAALVMRYVCVTDTTEVRMIAAFLDQLKKHEEDAEVRRELARFHRGLR